MTIWHLVHDLVRKLNCRHDILYSRPLPEEAL